MGSEVLRVHYLTSAASSSAGTQEKAWGGVGWPDLSEEWQENTDFLWGEGVSRGPYNVTSNLTVKIVAESRD